MAAETPDHDALDADERRRQSSVAAPEAGAWEASGSARTRPSVEPFNVAQLFHKLESGQFHQLRDTWMAASRPRRADVTSEQFCDILLPHCREAFPDASGGQICESLRELFSIADGARSGHVAWESFTDNIIEQAIRGQPNQVDRADNVLEYKYGQQCDQKSGLLPGINKSGEGDDVCRRLMYFPTVHRLLVCSRLNRAKICDPAADFAVVKTLNHEAPIMDACYVRRKHVHVGEQHVLLTTSADLTIRTFHGPKEDYAAGPEAPQTETQMVIRWSDCSQRVYTGARSGEVLSWSLGMQEDLRLESRSTGHSQPVMDLCPSAACGRKLFTVSLDKTLLQWDMARMNDPAIKPLEFKGFHKKGLYSTQYIDEYKLVLTAGFEFHILCWMEGQTTVKPFRLVDPKADDGHQHSIVRVCHVPGTPQVISCDRSGLAKVWDLRMFLPCQTFRAAPEGHRSADRKAGKWGEGLRDDSTITDFVYLERSRELLFNTPRQTFLYAYDGRTHLIELLHMLRDAPQKADTVKADLQSKRQELRDRVGLSRHLAMHSQAAQSLRQAVERSRRGVAEQKEHLRQLRSHMADQLDPSCAHEAHSPVVLALYNASRLQFLTAGGTEVKIWDSVTGATVTYVKGIFGGTATMTAGCAESTGNKFVVGAADGRVALLRVANCGVIREFQPPARGGWGEISAVAYVDEDRIVVAATTSPHGGGCGVLKMWSDALPGGGDVQRGAPLKSFDMSFQCRVLRPSSSLGLLLAGDEGGIVTCLSFDGQGCSTAPPQVVHRCDPPQLDAGECCAICTLSPYPGFASADASAAVCIWSVRPFMHGDCLLARWENAPAEVRHADGASPHAEFTPNITSLAWQYPFSLYGGDEVGRIAVWNVSDVVIDTHLRRAPRRQDASFPRPQWQGTPAPAMRLTWKAHDDGVRALQYVPDDLDQRAANVVSSGHDNRVRIWRIDADNEVVQVGSLCLASATTASPPWSFRPRTQVRRGKHRQSDVGQAAVTEFGRARLRAVPAFIQPVKRRRSTGQDARDAELLRGIIAKAALNTPGPSQLSPSPKRDSPGSPAQRRATFKPAHLGSPRTSMRKVALVLDQGSFRSGSPGSASPTMSVLDLDEAGSRLSSDDEQSPPHTPRPRALRGSIFEHLARTDQVAEGGMAGSDASSVLEGVDFAAELRRRRNRRRSRTRSKGIAQAMAAHGIPVGSPRAARMSRVGSRIAMMGRVLATPRDRRGSVSTRSQSSVATGAVSSPRRKSRRQSSRASVHEIMTHSQQVAMLRGSPRRSVTSPPTTAQYRLPVSVQGLLLSGGWSSGLLCSPMSRAKRWRVPLSASRTALADPFSSPGRRAAKLKRSRRRPSSAAAGESRSCGLDAALPAASSTPSDEDERTEFESATANCSDSRDDALTTALSVMETEVSLRAPPTPEHSSTVIAPRPRPASAPARRAPQQQQQQQQQQVAETERREDPPPAAERRRAATRSRRRSPRRLDASAGKVWKRLAASVEKKRRKVQESAAEAPQRLITNASVSVHTTAYIMPVAGRRIVTPSPSPSSAAVSNRRYSAALQTSGSGQGEQAELQDACRLLARRERQKRAVEQRPLQLRSCPGNAAISWNKPVRCGGAVCTPYKDQGR
eukprot:TRINITY_DN1186_c0_g2_i1.p1 TRINITY_DN1186_c0_g2~~TRINITY_DN1186_c0_g2_i1.p1  ORF type:complete len:1639 (+),score=348.17 TRINITY_DN1186_c0_g2_i1:43-4917(+)